MLSRQFTMFLALGLPALSGLCPRPAFGQEYEIPAVEARVWLDRGAEPVLQKGERSRIYYRVSESAFVAIFHIDTNGNARMVFPSSPQENHYARAGRDYRVLFPGSSYWYVGDDPGIGYFFILASPEPFDFRDLGYSHFSGGWDLSYVGRQVYGDPYLAMDDYVGALIPDWEYVGYGLDFASYHVERRHDYPRFLCYDCHGFQPYYSWNPYGYSCTSFRVVIYNDPYYYPATRYRGTRVVYVEPRRGVAHFGFKERAVGEVGTPQVVVRNTPPVSQPGVEGNGTRRAVPRSGTPSVFSPGSTSGNPPAVTGRRAVGTEGSANRRSGTAGSGSGAGISTRTPTSTRSGTTGTARTAPNTIRTDPTSARGSGTTQRPTLERRPTGTRTTATPPRGTQTTRTPVTRPSSRVRNPGRTGGTGGSSGATVRSGGTTSRSNPTVRSGGTTSRSNPTVRSGGTTSRSNPTVRSGGTATRSNPTVRSGGTASRTNSKVRSGGTASRTTAARPKPVKRRVGGGGLTS